MFQWLAENAEGIKVLLQIIGMLAVPIVTILVRWGWVQKDSARVMAQGIEDSAGAATRILDDLKRSNRDGELTGKEIGDAIARGIKGEIRERAIKTGVKAVIGAVTDRAAEADPKDEKKPRRPLARILGLLRPKVLGG